MNRIFLIITLIFISYPVFSQKFKFGGEMGYHFFKMDNLRSINEKILKEIPFEARLISNYPAYYNFGFFIDSKFLENIGFGIRYNFNSTGSRISSKDYSGEYLLDSELESESLALYMFLPFVNKQTHFEINGMLELGYLHSKISITEYLSLINITMDKNRNVAVSNNLFLSPGIILNYNYSIFVIGSRIGYQLDFNKGVFVDSRNESDELLYAGENNLMADWTGAFINFTFAIRLY